jgi:hypothetical protein
MSGNRDACRVVRRDICDLDIDGDDLQCGRQVVVRASKARIARREIDRHLLSALRGDERGDGVRQRHWFRSRSTSGPNLEVLDESALGGVPLLRVSEP